VDFVRKAVKAIGQTAIKIESAAPRCVQVLLDLIQTRVSYVVQEAVVVIKVKPRKNRGRTCVDLLYNIGHLQEISSQL
jgi:vesicle coat complex subunit